MTMPLFDMPDRSDEPVKARPVPVITADGRGQVQLVATNARGTCCPHWKLEHRQEPGFVFGACIFSDCGCQRFEAAS